MIIIIFVSLPFYTQYVRSEFFKSIMNLTRAMNIYFNEANDTMERIIFRAVLFDFNQPVQTLSALKTNGFLNVVGIPRWIYDYDEGIYLEMRSY